MFQYRMIKGLALFMFVLCGIFIGAGLEYGFFVSWEIPAGIIGSVIGYRLGEYQRLQVMFELNERLSKEKDNEAK